MGKIHGLSLFFAATWLMPLISEPPDMTWITQSCWGGEAGTASVGFPGASLFRWLMAFSERKSRRSPLLRSSLTLIFSATQPSVLWLWSRWKSYQRPRFRKESGALVLWGHLTCWPICLRTLISFCLEIERWDMSGHMDTAIPFAFSSGRFWYRPRFLFPESFIDRGEVSRLDRFGPAWSSFGPSFAVP